MTNLHKVNPEANLNNTITHHRIFIEKLGPIHDV